MNSKHLTHSLRTGIFFLLWISLTVLSVQSGTAIAQGRPDPLPSIGSTAVIGTVNGIRIEAKVQSPSAQLTPLQIVCVFEYVEGDIFTSPPALPANVNGIVHVDRQLHGLITALRKSGKFMGHTLETLLITPPRGTIPAKKLLLIGLGDRRKFNAGIMTDVGRVGMREAIRLKVNSYSHASDLKDGGLDSPTKLVAANVLKGAINAYQTELYLKKRNYTDFTPIRQLTLLAGPAFYTTSAAALKEAIQTMKP